MNQDADYEIARALDELPHIIGATCATAQFRAAQNKKPGRDEYRACAAEYFAEFASQIAEKPSLASLHNYIARRIKEERQRILAGENSQVERRYDRYIDYG